MYCKKFIIRTRFIISWFLLVIFISVLIVFFFFYLRSCYEIDDIFYNEGDLELRKYRIF